MCTSGVCISINMIIHVQIHICHVPPSRPPPGASHPRPAPAPRGGGRPPPIFLSCLRWDKCMNNVRAPCQPASTTYICVMFMLGLVHACMCVPPPAQHQRHTYIYTYMYIYIYIQYITSLPAPRRTGRNLPPQQCRGRAGRAGGRGGGRGALYVFVRVSWYVF